MLSPNRAQKGIQEAPSILEFEPLSHHSTHDELALVSLSAYCPLSPLPSSLNSVLCHEHIRVWCPFLGLPASIPSVAEYSLGDVGKP